MYNGSVIPNNEFWIILDFNTNNAVPIIESHYKL